MKESIIKISKPTPKIQSQQDEFELQPEVPEIEETEFSEELQELTDIPQLPSMRFASSSSGGWKASDILREIRLDSFEICDLD